MLIFAYACSTDPDVGHDTDRTVTADEWPVDPTGSTTLPPMTCAEPGIDYGTALACDRPAGYADWPGGRALRLDVGDLAVGEPVAVSVAGGIPGERITLHLGRVCALDCPAERDGACFQPVDPVQLGEATADAAGEVRFDLTPDATWNLGWQVLQAVAPDRGAVSQAFVFAIHLPAEDLPDELSPLTLRSPSSWFGHWWPVAPGRRVIVTFDDPGYGFALFSTSTSDGVTTPREALTSDVWYAGPSGWVWESWWYDGSSWTTEPATLDVATVPLETAVAWYPDADGDGYGDPAGEAVLSTVPVPGASPDARDCDDGDPARAPWAPETCDDGVDQDCDGADRDCFLDGTYHYAGHAWPGWTNAPVAGELAAGGGTTIFAGAVGHVGARTDALDPTLAVTIDRAVSGVGDLAGDAATDLLFHANGGFGVVEGEVSDGEGALLTCFSYFTDATDLPAADVTGDGAADVLLTDRDQPGVSIFPGPIDFGTLDRAVIPTSATAPRIALGDADGDGLSDLWTSDLCLYLAPIADGAEASGCVGSPADDLGEAGLVAIDANADGHGDVVAGTPLGARAILGPLTGTATVAEASWGLVEAIPTERQSWAVGAAPDADGDGRIEAMSSYVEAVWSVPLGAGLTTSAEGRVLVVGDGLDWVPAPVGGGDFDGDGWGDQFVGAAPVRGTGHGAGATIFWGPGL